MDLPEKPSAIAKATFGAGCFWGVEAAYRQLPGVIATSVGYAGGEQATPSYQDVCTGRTGHAEVVQVTYDPGRISYEQLLELFWASHDPTQLNRQGPDVGTQYRSVVFAHDDSQRTAAEESRKRLIQSGRAVVTVIESAPEFWRAEEYHQQYLEKRGQASCRL